MSHTLADQLTPNSKDKPKIKEDMNFSTQCQLDNEMIGP